MGRYYWDSKTTVEQATRLSIFKLKEFGLLTGFRATNLTWTHHRSGHKSSIGIIVDTHALYARVKYTITDPNGNKTDYDYKIRLTTTLCYFGGVRYWFLCPSHVKGIQCGRRTGTLYLTSGENYFGCRHCCNLTYDSRNESRIGRPGGVGYNIKVERQIRELEERLKRRYYAGKPTRKHRQLLKFQHQLDSIDYGYMMELLRTGKTH